MTLIIIYIIGYITALIIIGTSNLNEDVPYIAPLKEALLWSLLSWIFVLLIGLRIISRYLMESKTFKTFKNYFEGKFK